MGIMDRHVVIVGGGSGIVDGARYLAISCLKRCVGQLQKGVRSCLRANLRNPNGLSQVLFLLVATASPVFAAASDQVNSSVPGNYAGVFVGTGRMDNRIVDLDGFANWGNPGWSVDYGDSGLVVGVLLGKKFSPGGLPLRLEIASLSGDLSGNTNRLDPVGLDETAESRFKWITSARAGIERNLGPATAFVAGGVAVARISNLVIDIDFGPGQPTAADPDDSFHDNSTEIGWTIGAGIEVAVRDGWTLRLEGSYLDFGEDTHYVNHSGGGRCGPGGERRPCPYAVENKLRMFTLALTCPFGR